MPCPCHVDVHFFPYKSRFLKQTKEVVAHGLERNLGELQLLGLEGLKVAELRLFPAEALHPRFSLVGVEDVDAVVVPEPLGRPGFRFERFIGALTHSTSEVPSGLMRG